MLMVAVCACLIGYVADGPHWPPPLQEQCLHQWWANLLFINNYFVSIEHMVSHIDRGRAGPMGGHTPVNQNYYEEL